MTFKLGVILNLSLLANAAFGISQLKMYYKDSSSCDMGSLLKYISMPSTERCSFTSKSCSSELEDSMQTSYQCSNDKTLMFPASAETRFMQIRYFEDEKCTMGKRVAVGTAMDRCQPMPEGSDYKSFRLTGSATKLTITACKDSKCLTGCESETQKMYPTSTLAGNCTTDSSAISAFYYMVPDEALEHLTISAIKAAFVQILDQNGHPITN